MLPGGLQQSQAGSQALSITTRQFVDGVAGRSYTTTVETTGGTLVLASCAVSGNFPSGMATRVSGSTCRLSLPAANKVAPGYYLFSVQVADTALPQHTDLRQFSLLMRPEFAITQAPLAQGVQARSYGLGTPAQPNLSQPVTTNALAAPGATDIGAVNETGNGPLTACQVASVTSGGSGQQVNLNLEAVLDKNDPSRCLLQSTSLPTPGTYQVTVIATDSGIPDPTSSAAARLACLATGTSCAVPPGNVPQTLPLTVQPPIAFSLNMDPIEDAVIGRTYGAPAKTSLVVSASGGLLTTQGLTFTLAPGGTGPNFLKCSLLGQDLKLSGAQTTANLTCDSGGTALSAAEPAATSTLIFVVSDAGNTATPAASTSTDSAGHARHSLTVRTPLVATVTQQGNATLTDPAKLLDGVLNRSYGTINGGSGAPTYTASGGLGASVAGRGAYRWCISSGSASIPTGFNANFISTTCGLTTSTVADTVLLQSNAVQTGGSYSFALEVDDAGNDAVPDSVSSKTSGSVATTVTIQPLLAANLNQAGNPTPTNPSALLDGVAGRSYGLSGGTPTYTGAGGLGSANYQWCVSSGAVSLPGGLTGISTTCTSPTKAPTAGLTANPVSSAVATATSFPFTVQLDDTGNAATPSSAVTSSTTLTIQPPITFSLNLDSGTGPTGTAPDAVQGRTYGAPARTSLDFRATGGLSTSAGLVFALAGALPTGVSCRTLGQQAPGASANLMCDTNGVVVGTPAQVFNFQITVSDAGNAAAPSSPVSTDALGHTSHNITVQSPLNISVDEASVDPPPPGVRNRTYGSTSAGFKALVYDASGGLGGYNFNPPPSGLPAGIVCSPDSPVSKLTCTSGASVVTAAPGSYPFSATLDDTANATTPSGSASSTTASKSLSVTIDDVLALTPPASALAAGVAGRVYGQGTGCAPTSTCAPFTYTVQNGLGGYSSSPTLAGFPGNFACPFTSTGSLSGTYTCSSSNVGGTGNFALKLTTSDTANPATPSASISDQSAALAVNPEMTYSAQPANPLPTAVKGRTYGTASSGCSPGPACLALTYTVASGSGLGGYSFTPKNFPAGIGCAASSAAETCSSTAVTATPATVSNIAVTVSDAANQSTPSNTVSSTSARMSVNPEMTFSAQPSNPFPTAVTGRAYGTASSGCVPGPACSPLVYSVTNGSGLGGYSFTTANFPAGIGCVQGSGASANTETCSSAAGVTASPAVISGITVAATDTGNPATPANSITSPSGSMSVNAAMTLTPPSGALATAVNSRAYGQGNACGAGGTSLCAPINYTMVGGLGNYQSPAAMTTTAGTFNCPLAGTTYSCSSSNITGTGGSNPGLTLTATETGNASTPGASATDSSKTLSINAALTVPNPSPFPVPEAVTGRVYGTGTGCNGSPGNCVPLSYTPTGGLPPYTLAGSAFPAPISCTQAGSTLNCSTTSPVTGSTSSGTVTVTDTANASAPAGSSNRSDTITVNSALAIINTTAVQPPVNGLLEYPYSFAFTATGGLPAYNWVVPGATSGACVTAPTGSLPTSLSLSASSGVLSGTPSKASATAGDFTFQICVSDTPNFTTPAAFALPSTPGNNYVVNILPTHAFVADPGLGQVDVLDTGTPTVSPSASTVTTISATSPYGVAVTPNGREAYVTLSTTDKFAVIDAISDSSISGSPFSLPSGCVPHGVAISPDGSRAYIACSGNNEVVVIETKDNTTVDATISTGSSSTPEAVAIKADGSRAYVTLSGSNGLLIIDNTASPPASVSTFPLTTTTATPEGIALVANSTDTFAYIAKKNSGAAGAVDVVNVDTDTLSVVESLSVGATNSLPNGVAATPDGLRVYVTLNGTNQYVVIDNTVKTPKQIIGSPFSLTTSSAPLGLTIPPLNPVPMTGVRVFISQSGTMVHDVAIIDNSTPPAADAVPSVNLGALATPNGIANVPVPK